MDGDALYDPFGLRCVIAVPIRSFEFGKARLADALPAEARRELVRTLAEQVVGAAGRASVVVVSSDPEVVAWAQQRLCFVLDDPGSLNGAAHAARAWAADRGAVRLVIAHADLPFAHDLDDLAEPGAAPVALVVPDRDRDGTPVLSIPTSGPFEFAYGPGSFGAHCAAARAAGLAVEIVRDAALGFDLDEPADLAALHGALPEEPR